MQSIFRRQFHDTPMPHGGRPPRCKNHRVWHFMPTCEVYGYESPVHMFIDRTPRFAIELFASDETHPQYGIATAALAHIEWLRKFKPAKKPSA